MFYLFFFQRQCILSISNLHLTITVFFFANIWLDICFANNKIFILRFFSKLNVSNIHWTITVAKPTWWKHGTTKTKPVNVFTRKKIEQ